MVRSEYFKNLSANDIKKLITLYKNRIKTLKSEYKRKQSAEKGRYSRKPTSTTELEQDALTVLRGLGYCNELYSKDVILLTNKFYKNYNWSNRHGRFSNDLLKAVIVAEVLYYYDAKFSRKELFKFSNLKEDDGDAFYKLWDIVSQWSKNNYWK